MSSEEDSEPIKRRWGPPNWEFQGSLRLDNDEKPEDTRGIQRLRQRVSARFGDTDNAMLSICNHRYPTKPNNYADLKCVQHDGCPVRYRIVINRENHNFRLEVYRNNKDHDGAERGSIGSSYKTTRVPDSLRERMLQVLEVSRRTTATQLFNKFFKVESPLGPQAESAEEKQKRRDLYEYCKNLKANFFKRKNKGRIDTAREFVAELSPYEWTDLDWDDALNILDRSEALRPGVVKLEHHLPANGGSFVISIASTLSVESIYNCASDLRKYGGGFVIYVDGQASVARGNDCCVYTCGISKVAPGTGVGGAVIRTSLIPLTFSLISSESSECLKTVFRTLQSFIRRITDIPIVAVVMDAAKGCLLACKTALGPAVFTHRCRFHRNQATQKAKLSQEQKGMVRVLTDQLMIAPDQTAYDGYLRSIITDANTPKAVKKYMRVQYPPSKDR
ncbi:hypothetical protein FOL46_002335 [Perkinsus olseni]|uniref:MULE transposase domain-containing protein n=1 Tax=Perkinsus olseni TaxID=32597 RepID=A0A7J6KR07_PEROL|nr:hypothetical protein FOL46_002335 [Perkinsus olseni]